MKIEEKKYRETKEYKTMAVIAVIADCKEIVYGRKRVLNYFKKLK